ncbi:hypothetical protein [Hyphomicrobium sp.]|uniref:hypothetical protein n=1 Tax=Hyphomicrobium sp. TaxID=82 RepID=UPI001D826ED2|nr:hypothetical protein [Hyphomicrobium sp.]MBY0562453.1 hypothetical protein [Hyphomicrobium sp.]
MAEVTTTKTYTETYQRGPLNRISTWLFWGWNIFMIWAIFKGANDVATSTNYQHLSGDEKKWVEAGAGLGIMINIFFWAAGAVVFGALKYFTRGKKIIVETVTAPKGAAGAASGSSP